jgi:hypothetical protein
MMSGGREGGEGGVKKCILGLRQTALLSAEGKKASQLGLLCSNCNEGKLVGKGGLMCVR